MATGADGGPAHAALVSRKRRDVLEFLTLSDTPLGATGIAARMDLHVTTVRFHLEQLEIAGLIRREVDRDGRRGRPRIVYVAAPLAREDDAHRQLIDVLAGALDDDAEDGSARATTAGKQWADSLAQEIPTPTDADTLDPLMQIMVRLGFDPKINDGGDLIQLLACPFRQTARNHPSVVCAVHRGLIERTLDNMGHDPGEATLHPFVQQELCTITLHRG